MNSAFSTIRISSCREMMISVKWMYVTNKWIYSSMRQITRKKYFLCQSFSFHNMIFSIWKPFQCFQNYLFQVNWNYQSKIKRFHWNNNRKIIWKKDIHVLYMFKCLSPFQLQASKKLCFFELRGNIVVL